MNERKTLVVIGSPVRLENVKNKDEYLFDEGSENEIHLFDGWEIDGEYGILGRKVASVSSRMNGEVKEVHNQDLLSSYRKHRSEVKKELQDHDLLDREKEISLYFVMQIK